MKHGTRDKKLFKSLVYFSFAREFGYTPSQVDELPVNLIEEFMEILKEVNKQ